MLSPGPYQSPRSPGSHCYWKLQGEQSPKSKYSYTSQNLHLSPLASRSQPCSCLASVALRALENPPSTEQMLNLAVPLDIEESYFLQGPPWDQAGLIGWVWGANLEEINRSKKGNHFPGHHPWSLCSIKRKGYCLPFLEFFENHRNHFLVYSFLSVPSCPLQSIFPLPVTMSSRMLLGCILIELVQSGW